MFQHVAMLPAVIYVKMQYVITYRKPYGEATKL